MHQLKNWLDKCKASLNQSITKKKIPPVHLLFRGGVWVTIF
jgi:hypothetical protein